MKEETKAAADRPPLEDYRWLVDGEADGWLQMASHHQRTLVALASTLRRELSAARTHLVLEQVELRRRARIKFKNAGRMFFTSQGLEQATGEPIAAYKASRFVGRSRVADLCCGIGGDCLALAQRLPVTGVDRCPVTALVARANCEQLGLSAARIDCASVGDQCIHEFDAWHIDPDRRASGRRTARVEAYEPDQHQINAILNDHADGSVKLAPAAGVPESWKQQAELEWISDGRECKQLVAWFGRLAQFAGQRRATQIGRCGKPYHLFEQKDVTVPDAADVQRYLHEPDAAILAANLGNSLANKHNLHPVTPGIAYFTSNQVPPDPMVASFEVIEVLPLDIKRLRASIRRHDIGHLEVKKRSVDVEPRVLAQQLAGVGSRPATLLIMPRGGRATAVLAWRLKVEC